MTETKYPSAVYAAAGVGDFVYEQLRKLQDKAVAFGAEASTQDWKKKVADLGTKIDAGKVRESVVTGTQVAAERAGAVYSTLVNRGEKAFATQNGTTPKPAGPASHTAPADPSAAARAKTVQEKTEQAKAEVAEAQRIKAAQAKAQPLVDEVVYTTKTDSDTPTPAEVAKKATPRKKAV
jgi:hypothetical protein